MGKNCKIRWFWIFATTLNKTSIRCWNRWTKSQKKLERMAFAKSPKTKNSNCLATKKLDPRKKKSHHSCRKSSMKLSKKLNQPSWSRSSRIKRKHRKNRNLKSNSTTRTSSARHTRLWRFSCRKKVYPRLWQDCSITRVIRASEKASNTWKTKSRKKQRRKWPWSWSTRFLRCT